MSSLEDATSCVSVRPTRSALLQRLQLLTLVKVTKGLQPSKSKVARGKSGIEFRHCKSKECERLSDAQRKELDQRCKTDKKGGRVESQKKDQLEDKRTSSTVAKEVQVCFASVSVAETKDEGSDSEAAKTDGALKTVQVGAAEAAATSEPEQDKVQVSPEGQ